LHPIIGVLVFCLGFPVMFLAIIPWKHGETLVSANGEKLGTIKPVSRSRFNLEVPARSWTGSLVLDRVSVTRILSASTGTGTLTTSIRDYHVKMQSILEDDDNNRLFTVYGYNNDFVITKDDKFDPVITCLTAYCLIKSFLTVKDSEYKSFLTVAESR
ncbi:MAG: hypothetical protein ACFFD4_14890, partial [Candidatus Odinarchaeota archaeon]